MSKPSLLSKKAKGFAEWSRKANAFVPRKAWWYEDEKGISVHCEPEGSKVISVEIPWGALMRAAKRCRRTPEEKR